MLWVCVTFLSLIMIAVATRRVFLLWSPTLDVDVEFARRRFLTLAHIIPGLIFIVLGPFQFVSSLRKRHPNLHRWTGRVFLAAALVIGVTALIMSPQMPIGGDLEVAATFVFGALFLFTLGKGFAAIRARKVVEHRRWMIRAYAIGLGVGTVRPIAFAFFATSRLTHLTARDFFGIAFWLGFIVSLAAAEVWIRTTSRFAQTAR